jgi:DNA anti-recombination protein RmuC
MAAETKIVKGGFRATLALLISIIALIVSIIAYTSTGKEDELNTRIRELQTKLEDMKEESAKRLDKLRGETANALEKLGRSLKKEEKPEEDLKQ